MACRPCGRCAEGVRPGWLLPWLCVKSKAHTCLTVNNSSQQSRPECSVATRPCGVQAVRGRGSGPDPRLRKFRCSSNTT